MKKLAFFLFLHFIPSLCFSQYVFTNATTANGLGNNYVYEVYASGSTVYAATEGGLSFSTDGGASFTTKTTANGLGSDTVSGVYAIGSTVFAATEGSYFSSDGGLSISTDAGATFTTYTISDGLGSDEVLGTHTSGGIVYAATSYGLSFGAWSAAVISLTGPATVQAGSTSTAITLRVEDGNGNPFNVSSNTVFALSTGDESATATFTPSTVTVPAGSSSATFTYANTKVGDGTHTLTATRSSGDTFTGSGMTTLNITVTAKAASTLTIDPIANQTYTGSAITPAVVVKDGSTTLIETTDYTIAFTDNTNVGTATITITGAGNYTGTKTQTFAIARPTLSIVSGNNQTGPVNQALAAGPIIKVMAADGSPAANVAVTVSASAGQISLPVLSNLSETFSTGGSTITNSDWKAYQFTTGSSAIALNQVDLVLNSISGSYPEIVQVEAAIYSVVNGLPAIEIGTSGIQSVPLPATATWQTLEFTNSIDLIPNTSYALVVKSGNASGFKWGNVRPNSTTPAGNLTYLDAKGTSDMTNWVSVVQHNGFSLKGLNTLSASKNLLTNANGAVSIGFWVLGDRAGTQQLVVTNESLFASSLTISATATAVLPSEPTNLSFTPDNGQVSLSYTPGYDGGSSITNYEYSVDNGSSWTALNPVDTSSPITITGLTNGVTYPVKIRAVSVVGQGTASAAISVNSVIPFTNLSITVDPIVNQTYTGSALTPAVVVKDGNTTLTATSDYTVAYSNNTNVGTATITITGAGNYTGTITQTFAIAAKAAITLTIDPIANQTYTGSAITPAVVVKDGSTTLTETTDYTIAFTDNTNVGTATITITGAGNYTGTKTQTFAIAAKVASTLTIDPIANQTYTGSAIAPAVVVKDGSTTLTETTDYTIAFTDNTNVGTATITITGAGNYTGTKTQTFAIAAKAASTLTIDPIANQTYTGSAIAPAVVVKDGSTTLTATTDYTVAYTNNTNVGTATVTITGVGNYTGTKTQTFNIAPKSLTLRAENASKIYGDANPELSFSYSGLVAGDTRIDELPSISTSATANSAVGNYKIVLSGGSDSNYDLSFVEGVLEVIPANLTLIANSVTKIYGQEDPFFGYKLDGLKGLDTEVVITGSLAREGGEDPGIYSIGLGNVSSGANYDLSFVGGTIEILIARALSVVELEAVRTNWSKEATFPSTVTIGTTDGQFFNLGVIWETSTLNLFARGTYTVYGTLVLPVGIENPDGLKAQLQVIVLPKPAPQDVTITNDTFAGSTSVFFIPVGSFVVNDPVDNIHVVSLNGPGYDNKYFYIQNNVLYWNSAERAPGKTKFTILVRVTDRDGNTLDKFFTINRTRKDFSSLTITNAFSPNGDWSNDAWGVPDLRFYEGVRIQIFDQGGNRVYYTENPDIRWDGTFEGKNLPVGTYYWIIEILETGEMRRGMLNLIRK